VQLLDEETQSVLRIVDYAERIGDPVTTEEFRDFAMGPRRKTQFRTNPVFAITSGEKTKEPVFAFISRAKFISVGDGGIRLTRLGRLVLSEAAEIETEANQPKDILLAAGDEWAPRDMIRSVRQAGPCLVVDPYCREAQLNELLRHTEATRVLVGPAVGSEDFELTLGRVRPPRRLELRVSADIHDRHVIPDAGPVLGFGTSLNAVGGNKPTIVVTLSEALSAAVRGTYNDLWDKAEAWVAPVSAQSLEQGPEAPEEAEGDLSAGSQPS